MKNLGFILAFSVFMNCPLFSQIWGSLDPTFSGDGKLSIADTGNGIFQDVKIQPDQKIVASGTLGSSNHMSAMIKVIRFLHDGSKDSTFGVGGVFSYAGIFESRAHDSYINSDGSIYVAGQARFSQTGDYAWLLLKLKSNGTLDSAFGNNGVVIKDFTINLDDELFAITVQKDGKILLAGTIDWDARKPTVARFNADGSIDSTFGTNGIAQIPILSKQNYFKSITIQPDGKILASGYYSNNLLTTNFMVARFNSNGSLDNSFGQAGVVILPNVSGGLDQCVGMVLKNDGHILLAGFYYLGISNSGGLLMQIDSTGNFDDSFGSGGLVKYKETNKNIGFYDVNIQPDGKIICTGGSYDMFLIRFNADGSLDSDFAKNGKMNTDFIGNDAGNAIALQDNGKIVIAGKGNGTFGIARYINKIGDIRAFISEDSNTSSFKIYPNPIISSVNQSIEIQGDFKNNGPSSIELFNVLGSKIASFDFGVQAQKHFQASLQLPALDAGVYFLKMKNNETINDGFKLIVK